MSKLAFATAAMFLAGCASTGGWRTLTIDGSSESAFGDSLARLNDELPWTRRQMFGLALVDIARSGSQNLGDEGSRDQTSAGSEEGYGELRFQLDGLTYDGVIALADQTGPTVYKQYYAGRRVRPAIDGVDMDADLIEPAFDVGGSLLPNQFTLGYPEGIRGFGDFSSGPGR
jgi:hypothetical protein